MKDHLFHSQEILLGTLSISSYMSSQTGIQCILQFAGLSISNIVFFFFFFSVFYASTAPAHRASGRPAQTARARFGFTRRLSSVVAREVQVGAALQRRRGGAARHRGHRVVPVQVIGTWTGREVDINGGGEELGEDHCTGRF